MAAKAPSQKMSEERSRACLQARGDLRNDPAGNCETERAAFNEHASSFETRQDCVIAIQQRFREASGGLAMDPSHVQRGSFFGVAPDGRAATGGKCVLETGVSRKSET